MLGRLMTRLNTSFLVLLSLTLAKSVQPQDPQRDLLLEVIRTTHDIERTETLVYLRVFADGSAEAHPTYKVDFRTLALKKSVIPPSDMAKLREVLSPSNTSGLKSEYERYWGNIDFGDIWKITIGQGEAKKEIILTNFQPFLARRKKEPYPGEIERIGCLTWELRWNVFKEPLGRDYVRACRELGY